MGKDLRNTVKYEIQIQLITDSCLKQKNKIIKKGEKASLIVRIINKISIYYSDFIYFSSVYNKTWARNHEIQ